MKILTWNEFKKIVDDRIAKDGKTRDIVIFCIDTGSYPSKENITVSTDEDELSIL